MRALLKDIFEPRRFPWAYLVIFLGAGVITASSTLRALFVYNRDFIGHGEIWRVWTGHLVHFGWTHFLADGLLFLVIGWALERASPRCGRISLAVLPLVVSASLFWFDPGMLLYGGLSGVNVGLLVFMACRGWQKNWMDWFWPAILAIHVLELVLEIHNHGTGGGAIRFDTPSIHVATVAHIGGALYGVTAWAIIAQQTRGIGSEPTRS
jgi:rhomboid family GlyGly-CTERM serine protease